MRARAAYVAVAAVQLAIFAWFAARSYFTQDDFRWLAEAHYEGSSVLGRTVFGSFAPGFRAMYFPLVAVHGSWAATVALEVALAALGAYQLWRLLALCCGPVPQHALVAVTGATSAIWIPTAIWPADALHLLPYICLSLLVLEGFIRHDATGSRRWLAASVVAYAIALLYWNKAALLPLHLALLCALILDSRGLRAIW